MADCDDELLEKMAEDGVTDQEQDTEMDAIMDYKAKVTTAKNVASRILATPDAATTAVVVDPAANQRNFRLPRIELKKFSGELKDWLGFWSCFKKIDEDDKLHGSDKFQYLLQSMVPGTDPFEIISAYPQSEDTYPKAVEALKKRYGNEDLLLQVYIRELLKLVISNVNSDNKITFQSLHVKLDSHLRALKTLKLEKADPATWLFPMVESSLPEEILLTWQRSPLSSKDGSKENPPKTRLDCLMEFLGKEVEIKQKIELAQSTFGNDMEDSKIEKKASKDKKKEKVPMLAGFHNGEGDGCAFCGKSHESKECFAARSMTVEQKTKMLKDKRLCFKCFKPRHMTKDCKAFVKCMMCGSRHHILMCPDLEAKRNPGASPPVQDDVSSKEKLENLTDLSGHVCSSQVPLQTLMVEINDGGKRRLVRGFMDSGCQRSYLLNSTVNDIGLKPVNQERVTHSVFRGGVTQPVLHNVYNITVGKPGGGYRCTIKIRDEDKICNRIPKISRSTPGLFDELRYNNIKLSDVVEDSAPIQLLIGNDYFGYLQTGKKITLKSGIVALETKFGWVLSGHFGSHFKESYDVPKISMCAIEASISNLWDLEILGIKDSADIKSAEEKEAEIKATLFQSISRKSDGRYVVLKRLERETKKIVDAGKYSTYDQIFKDWEREGFIEQVPVGKGYLLPHRPVFKESLTTPARPVFDGSCKGGRGPSLNECLEKGSNYVQLIPEILARFREKKIGIVSDIRKAFQMIEVQPGDRDAMRFTWWKCYEKRELMEYRHVRVMFGATCSPFVLGAVLEFHLKNVKKEDREVASKLLEAMYVDNCVSSED